MCVLYNKDNCQALTYLVPGTIKSCFYRLSCLLALHACPFSSSSVRSALLPTHFMHKETKPGGSDFPTAPGPKGGRGHENLALGAAEPAFGHSLSFPGVSPPSLLYHIARRASWGQVNLNPRTKG